MELHLVSLQHISQVAEDFLKLPHTSKVFAFVGEMGVGKTTFIKALCKQLGVEEAPVSPTFSIVNEYLTSSNQIIYHFDLYRINSIDELIDLGFEEYMYSNSYCFIEWPQIAEQLLPDNLIICEIVLEEDNSRSIRIR